MPESNNDELIDEMARKLAVNYYHASLSTKNPHYLSENDPYIQKHQKIVENIFESSWIEESLFNENFGYSRNILIVGAGASKNAYSEILTAREIIHLMYKNLGIYQFLLGVNHYSDDLACNTTWSKLMTTDNINYHRIRKFKSDVQIHIGEPISEGMTLYDWVADLGFEKSLKIAEIITNKSDIAEELKKLLSKDAFRFIPNLFYEVLAHLFKHRFIDVIINLNFDELLDNAIEDELGSTEYIKIYNEATCTDFRHSVVDNRLRKPIYIKPHGTVSDINSMQFTIEDYLSASENITKHMSNIFSGSLMPDNKEPIKNINVIMAGYSFSDLDMINIISSNFRNHLTTTLYVLESDKREVSRRAIDKLTNSCNDGEVEATRARITASVKSLVVDRDKSARNNLNNILVDLFERLRVKFLAPFRPTGIYRHQFQCMVFSDELITACYNLGNKGISKFILHRFFFNILYDYIKFNGQIPLNVITMDRAGKYFREYVRFKQSLGFKTNRTIISFLNRLHNEDFVRTRYYYLDQKFYEASYSTDEKYRNGILLDRFKKVYHMLFEMNKHLALTEDNTIAFLKKIAYTGFHDINANYDDPKHREFLDFDKKHIINTNLGLTWYFYDFAINRILDYDHIDIISKTGNAIVNLKKYSSSESNLKKLYNRPINIDLYHLVDFEKAMNINEDNQPKPVRDYFEEAGYYIQSGDDTRVIGSEPRVKLIQIGEEIEMHQMVLFSKIDTENKKHPVMGIYFFKPLNKIRINPVWFTNEKTFEDDESNNGVNLSWIKNIFEIVTKDISTAK